MSVVEKLRVLLAEKFERRPWEKVELLGYSSLRKWMIAVRLHLFEIFITAYENGKMQVDAGPERTRSEISEFYLWKKYKHKYEEAKTDEEKKRILQKEKEERNRIIEDFKQRRFEDYIKKGGVIAYFAGRHMWGDEVARRVSEKHGLEVRFEIDTESCFFTTFDSTRMDDEQLINETMKRVDAINEAREMFFNKELENEFLASKGIEVERKRSRRRRVSRG
jgi:hypothetical protein